MTIPVARRVALTSILSLRRGSGTVPRLLRQAARCGVTLEGTTSWENAGRLGGECGFGMAGGSFASLEDDVKGRLEDDVKGRLEDDRKGG